MWLKQELSILSPRRISEVSRPRRRDWRGKRRILVGRWCGWDIRSLPAYLRIFLCLQNWLTPRRDNRSSRDRFLPYGEGKEMETKGHVTIVFSMSRAIVQVYSIICRNWESAQILRRWKSNGSFICLSQAQPVEMQMFEKDRSQEPVFRRAFHPVKTLRHLWDVELNPLYLIDSSQAKWYHLKVRI